MSAKQGSLETAGRVHGEAQRPGAHAEHGHPPSPAARSTGAEVCDPRIVPVRSVSGSPLAAWALALPLGVLSGLLLHAIAMLALVALAPGVVRDGPSSWVLLVFTAGAGGVLATIWLTRGRGRLSSVLARGLRLGTVLWALLAAAQSWLGPRESARALELLHAAGGGLLAVPGEPTALALAAACLLGALLGALLPHALPRPVRQLG